MAIPNGTKFHGVAPQVPTQNRGSAQLNSLRDVYTFPDDFAAGIYSYSGAIINIGAGNTNPFNADTVEWGGISSPTDQCSVLMFPEQVLIKSVYFKITQPNQPSVDMDYVFNLYTSNDLEADPMNAGTWTQLGSLVSGIDGTDGATHGFIEDTTSLNLIVPAGSMLAMAGIEQAGSFANNTTEAIIGLVAVASS